MNVMPVERRNQILRLLVEGNSIRSVTRLMGTNIRSVLRQLNWAGEHCRKLMDERFQNLTLKHLECDETWTFVLKKQARLTTEERAERGDIGDVYLWIAIDQPTRLIPAYLLNKRSADGARRFMRNVASRLAFPTAHASDRHGYADGGFKTITQLSTDGFAAYPEATDTVFGPYASHGVLIKDFRNRFLMPGAYVPAEMVGTQRKVVRGDIDPYDVCTSHCERWNLTARRSSSASRGCPWRSARSCPIWRMQSPCTWPTTTSVGGRAKCGLPRRWPQGSQRRCGRLRT